MATLNFRQKQFNQALTQFYAKPVAKVSLELFFSIITVIVFALFAIRPTLITMSDLIKEIDDKKALDNKLKQKIAELSTVQSIYLSNQDRWPVLDKAIPLTPQFDQAVLMIEKMASDHNLLIMSMNAKEVPPEPVKDVDFSQKSRTSRSISVGVIGDYASIRAFAEDLRNSQRMFVVESIVFSVTDQQGSKQLRAMFNVNIEYFGPTQ